MRDLIEGVVRRRPHELGITRQCVDRICPGVNRPSLPLAVKIEKFTLGAIPVEEWVKSRPK